MSVHSHCVDAMWKGGLWYVKYSCDGYIRGGDITFVLMLVMVVVVRMPWHTFDCVLYTMTSMRIVCLNTYVCMCMCVHVCAYIHRKWALPPALVRACFSPNRKIVCGKLQRAHARLCLCLRSGSTCELCATVWMLAKVEIACICVSLNARALVNVYWFPAVPTQ